MISGIISGIRKKERLLPTPKIPIILPTPKRLLPTPKRPTPKRIVRRR